MTGNFDTFIVHSADKIVTTATQTQVSNAEEPSPVLEHIESLSVSNTGEEAAALQ